MGARPEPREPEDFEPGHTIGKLIDKFESYPMKKRPLSVTTYLSATGKRARDIIKRGSEVHSSR